MNFCTDHNLDSKGGWRKDIVQKQMNNTQPMKVCVYILVGFLLLLCLSLLHVSLCTSQCLDVIVFVKNAMSSCFQNTKKDSLTVRQRLFYCLHIIFYCEALIKLPKQKKIVNSDLIKMKKKLTKLCCFSPATKLDYEPLQK